jgi:tetratricopeptide (TPR) repeat protein/transglutaminase-like putative cysteine protease
VGDVLEYRVHYRVLKPVIPGQFWYENDFIRTGVVLDEELEINVPKDREVKVKSLDVKPAIREEATRRIYLWKTSNLEQNQPEETLPGSLAPPSVLLSSFRSWEELGAWWSGLAQPQVTPTPEVRAKAAELTYNAKSEAEKIRAIYDFVATNYRYIGVAFGIGRFQPHPAGEVFKNGYGDCKDKHTLLASLLQTAGVQAYPVLINSLRKIDPDVPSPTQFDHVITAVPQGTGMLWLDTTPEVAPFGYLLFNLRDKLALITPQGKPAYLAQTPAAPPFAPFVSLEVKGKLASDGTLQAHFQESVRGGVEILMRMAFRGTPQAQWKDLVQNVSQAQGYGGAVSNVTTTAPALTAEPFSFSYDYTRKDYPDWPHHQITAPLAGFGLPPASDDPTKAAQTILLGEPTETHFHSEIQIPEGYTPVFPDSVSLNSSLLDFTSSYAFKRGVIITDYQLKVKQNKVAPSQAGDYRNQQKIIDEVPRRYTELIASPGGKGLTASTPRARAKELMGYARLAASQGKFSETFNYVRQATDADPQLEEAWLLLASMLVATNKVDEGTTAYRKAIDANPDNANTYKTLARLLNSHDHPEEAIKVWRDLLKRNPNDTEAHSNLADLLMSRKRYREAIVELEAANDPDHPNSSVAAQLAEAYLGSGEIDKATGMLRNIAATDPRPETLSDVACKLADANADLTDAQGFAEKAVQAEESASSQVTIDAEGTASIEATQALAQSWDALGWVSFRLGNFAKAKSYLHAAWMLAQSSSAADHLGQVYEREGKKEPAVHMYGAAVAVNSQDSEAQGRLEHLVGNRFAANGEINAARGDLYQVRTIRVAGAGTLTGSSDVLILFSNGPKVEQVRLLTNLSNLKSAEKAVAETKFDVPFPDDRPTRLVHSGKLSCGKYIGCTLVLMPLNSAQ